jgi:hypothetical protein
MVNGADGENFGESQLGKFTGADVVAVIIDFVDGHQRLLARAAQPGGDFLVQRHDAFMHIDDQDDDACGFDGQFDLLEGGAADDVAPMSKVKHIVLLKFKERERLLKFKEGTRNKSRSSSRMPWICRRRCPALMITFPAPIAARKASTRA